MLKLHAQHRKKLGPAPFPRSTGHHLRHIYRGPGNAPLGVHITPMAHAGSVAIYSLNHSCSIGKSPSSPPARPNLIRQHKSPYLWDTSNSPPSIPTLWQPCIGAVVADEGTRLCLAQKKVIFPSLLRCLPLTQYPFAEYTLFRLAPRPTLAVEAPVPHRYCGQHRHQHFGGPLIFILNSPPQVPPASVPSA
jgi:hypothetical protein